MIRRHPLEVYADSYAQMSRDGEGRVDCRAVEVDIRQNMMPVTQAVQAITDEAVERAAVEDQPRAFLVHDFHIARSPVKARGRFPEATEYLYPAAREADARSTARTLGATCTPLFALKGGGE